jgi:CheY-like chemotaxis protein
VSRILVVDDNRDSAESLSMLLREMGHEVDVAVDPRAALEIAFRERPEFVFLDLNLPDMHGTEVAEKLRSDPALSRVRLIAITGSVSDDDRKRAHDAGFEAYLVKPFNMDFVRSLLGHHA